MKIWKKLLTMLLALAMILAFTACDNSKDENKQNDDKGSAKVEQTQPEETDPPTEPEPTVPDIYGEWSMRRDISVYFNDMLSMQIGEAVEMPQENIDLLMTLKFDTDTEFIVSVALDEESFVSYVKALCGVMTDYMSTMLEAQGVTQADFEAQVGMTLEEYVDLMMEGSYDGLSDTFEGEMFNGYFRIDGDRLYIEKDKDDLEDDESYMVFSLDGDKLTVLEKVGEDVEENMEVMDMFGMTFPWVFEKQ